MRPVHLLFALFLFPATISPAQSLIPDILPKTARRALSDYVFVPGGTFSQGYFEGRDSLEESHPRDIAVAGFLISRFEVTNAEYRLFTLATGNPANLPDTTTQAQEPSALFDEPMRGQYFSHPAFDRYPMVCVSWEQAVRYCQWKAQEINTLLKNTAYEVDIRLPGEAEWEYAALGKFETHPQAWWAASRRMFPWDGIFLEAGKTCGYKPHCNSGPIVSTQSFKLFEYPYDGGLFTVEVKHYEPNEYGLYQMAGNVAEWTADDYAGSANTSPEKQPRNSGEMRPVTLPKPYGGYKIVKGGSWNDAPFYMQCGVRRMQPAEVGSFTIGFRPVCVIRQRE